MPKKVSHLKISTPRTIVEDKGSLSPPKAQRHPSLSPKVNDTRDLSPNFGHATSQLVGLSPRSPTSSSSSFAGVVTSLARRPAAALHPLEFADLHSLSLPSSDPAAGYLSSTRRHLISLDSISFLLTRRYLLPTHRPTAVVHPLELVVLHSLSSSIYSSAAMIAGPPAGLDAGHHFLLPLLKVIVSSLPIVGVGEHFRGHCFSHRVSPRELKDDGVLTQPGWARMGPGWVGMGLLPSFSCVWLP